MREGKKKEAEKVIYSVSHLIKVICFMFYPFCPSTSSKVAQSYGIEWIVDESKPKSGKDVLGFQDMFRIKSTGVLFPIKGG